VLIISLYTIYLISCDLCFTNIGSQSDCHSERSRRV